LFARLRYDILCARLKNSKGGARMAAPHRIDVHHHVTPPSLRTEKMRAGAGGGPTYGWTLEKTLEDMEKGDVRGVVISMPYPIDIWPNPKDTRGITASGTITWRVSCATIPAASANSPCCRSSTSKAVCARSNTATTC
jgi:hypothetical protein